MNQRKEELEKKLSDIQERIRDQEARIPPHSVRPHQIQELENLEEERDRLLEELATLKKGLP